MRSLRLIVLALVTPFVWSACGKSEPPPAPAPAPAPTPAAKPFEVPRDPNNIVSIALASKDHTTLVAALKAADYVAAVANPGPLTVFAPTNDAFAKLPAGALDELLKPEKLDALKNVVKYHATTSVYEAKDLKDGMTLGMANGGKVTFSVADGKVTVNDATIVASVRASNGIVHVVDGVLLPPAK
ncbi:MAG: fasciclin domain-containing protein [Deltaproteobacteria bacterium]|nr:fasciclin domain-containing protein [Deltaproteobacteria bacterium]